MTDDRSPLSLSSIVILTLDHAVRPAGVLQQWVREPVTHCVITRRARRSYQCGCGFAFYPRHLESLCAHNGATGHATRHRLDAGCYDTLEMPPRDVRIFGRPRPPRERGRGKPVCGVRRGAARSDVTPLFRTVSGDDPEEESGSRRSAVLAGERVGGQPTGDHARRSSLQNRRPCSFSDISSIFIIYYEKASRYDR